MSGHREAQARRLAAKGWDAVAIACRLTMDLKAAERIVGEARVAEPPAAPVDAVPVIAPPAPVVEPAAMVSTWARPEPEAPNQSAAEAAKARFVAAKASACRWPLWDHRERPTFEFCGRPAEPGRPYCAAHAAIAYDQPKRRTRERDPAYRPKASTAERADA